jgi:hypothetical protein
MNRLHTPEDVEKIQSGWRKRQINNRDTNNIRNATLEEVAQEFDAMKSFGDTSASFAVFVRGMKKEWFK